MAWSHSAIEEFLTGHIEAGNPLDLDAIGAAYNDPFMFAGPSCVRVIPVAPFLAALPARRGFFDSIGQLGTELVSFGETVLDDNYVLVKASLKMRFRQADAPPAEAILDSTFLLFSDGGATRIVFHLESEDVAQAMRDRGLLPPESQGE